MSAADDRRRPEATATVAAAEPFPLALIPGGIGWFEWDLGSDRWRATPQVAALFGVAASPPPARFADCAGAILPEDLAALHAAARSAADSGAYYAEFRVRHADGSLHWLAGKGEVRRDGAGAPGRIAGVYYEISERKGLESRLVAAMETIEDRVAEEIDRRRETEAALRQAHKMEAIGQLTGGVAHDFGNLLMVILGNLETVQRRLGRGHELQRMIAAALASATRAGELTQRLLAFARRQPLAPEILSPNRLVAGMAALLQRSLGETIRLETALAPRIWATQADANQLENALLNLALNARDAMPDGGSLTIATANCRLDDGDGAAAGHLSPGDYVSITVTDIGIGMPPAVIDKAFEPFFTTKDPHHASGLGLSQVYGFAKQSGGNVTLCSTPGHGTSVTLYFPRHQAATDADAATPAEDGLAGSRSRRCEAVLIVEDDPDVRSYTADVTRELGYEVISADTGLVALELLDAHPEIGLLFTDVGLPGGMSGRQLADEATRRQPSLKVLFTTGYARDAMVDARRLASDTDIVFKPFTYTDLASKIRGVFDH